MIDALFLSPPRRYDGSQYLFNNATLQLASYLVQRGRSARIEPLFGSNWRERIDRAIETYQPRWVAVSCKWWDTVYGAVQVAEHVRRHHPEVRLVTGGQTASSFAQAIIEKTPFDAVITGDAELPLLQLVQGEPSCNAFLREGEHWRRLPQRYVQPREGGEALRLVPDLSQLAPQELLYHAGLMAPFVWTGKGCQSACSYCSGSAFGHKKLFGRTGFSYRPFEDVLHDIEVLAPWSGNSVMFDFDPVQDPNREAYYLELARQLPRGKYHAAFYCWSLPSLEFIEEASGLFASILVSLDAQTYSEPLRQRLAAKNQLKPFRSDMHLMQTLDFMRTRPNVHGVVYGILGLQSETPYDVSRTESFMGYLQDAYCDVLQPLGINLTPLSIEPDSLLDRNPEKFGMTRVRHGFDDYLELTRIRFHAPANESFHIEYRTDHPHPYGIYQSHEDPARVYRDFQRISTHLGAKAEQWEAERALGLLEFCDSEVTLTLKNRSIFQDDWRLILWAAGEAVERGLKRVVIDTREGHIRVPPVQSFPFDSQFAWAGQQWAAIERACQEGRIQLDFRLGADTQLGFLQRQSGGN